MVAQSNNHEPSSNFPQQTSIALWGPSGVGKDWLFRAFNKELDYFNQQDRDFHYEIAELQPGDPVPSPLTVEPPPTFATPSFEDHTYIFRRIAMLKDPGHQISAQEHDIMIHNDKGANLVDSLNDRITFETTFQTLINANNILLVLGIPSDDTKGNDLRSDSALPDEPDNFGTMMEAQFGLQVSAGETYSPEAMRADWSRAEYLKFTQLLLATLGKSPRRNLAICMTKSDQLNFKGEPTQMLQRRYGDALRRLLEVHSQNHNIMVFVTSAAGYIRLGGKVMPNFQNGNLRDSFHWNPVNTAAPFFWIFEQIERARLQKSSMFFRGSKLKNYLPYPAPRKF